VVGITALSGIIAALAVAAPATAQTPPSAPAAHALGTSTRLFVKAPDSAAVQQGLQLVLHGDLKDAAGLAKMEATPQAVWLDGGTPAQVQQTVRQTIVEAALQHAVPTFVAYDIPGRDCDQYSAGGALDQAAYESWISAVAAGIGNAKAIVLVEPDSLGNLPSDCSLPAGADYPFTDAARIAELTYAVGALEARPNTSVYLDGTHSAWQSVGTISQRLLEADVQQAQGFFLNVSNYQPTPALIDYGTWISDCLAMVTDSSNWAYGNPSACASQYYPATESDFSTWTLTTQWYAQNMGNAVATAHFVIDTSRNGQGANSMAAYGQPPYNQSAATVSTLAAGNWCNPPGAGLGLRPTTNTGVALLDAYLWVKTPGESDGQCDSAGGTRAWDYSVYTQPGWPTTAAAQAGFDPLWGTTDPAAGVWFPQQALQLIQDANPAILSK
jgi:endoglucanase